MDTESKRVAWNKGIPMREESKIKLSKSLMGKSSWNKGKKEIRQEVLNKLRKSHIGQKSWNKGIPMTEEQRKRMSESKKGKSAYWNIGRRLTEEQKKKISEATKKAMDNPEIRKKLSENHKGRHLSPKTEFKKGQVNWNKGKIAPFSEESLKRMSESAKNSINAGRITKEIRANLILPKKDSKPEIKIQDFLKQLNIEFSGHKYIHIKHAYQCDILIPSMSLIIEVDGNYWHKYPIGREIDKIRTKELQEQGFKVLRLWESDIKKMSLDNFKDKIEEVLSIK